MSRICTGSTTPNVCIRYWLIAKLLPTREVANNSSADD